MRGFQACIRCEGIRVRWMGGSCYGWTLCNAESMPDCSKPCLAAVSVVLRDANRAKCRRVANEFSGGSRAATITVQYESRCIERHVWEKGYSPTRSSDGSADPRDHEGPLHGAFE